VALVSNYFQGVEDLDSRVGTKREAHTATQSLLGQDLRHTRPHRGYDIDIANIPAPLEHAYGDDDSHWGSRLLHFAQLFQGLIRSIRVHHEDTVCIRAPKELRRPEDRTVLISIVDALSHHEHDGVHTHCPSRLAVRGDSI